MNKISSKPHPQVAYDREAFEVRARAAEVLAAIGTEKLRRVAIFRSARWVEVSIRNEQDRRYADLAWIRAVEWWRIGSSLPTENP